MATAKRPPAGAAGTAKRAAAKGAATGRPGTKAAKGAAAKGAATGRPGAKAAKGAAAKGAATGGKGAATGGKGAATGGKGAATGGKGAPTKRAAKGGKRAATGRTGAAAQRGAARGESSTGKRAASTVQVDVRGRAASQLPRGLAERVAAGLAHAQALAGEGDALLALSFVDDEEIHQLNRAYGEEDKPTDVLSFSMREGEGGELHARDADARTRRGPAPPRLLGDVVISVETAARQAAAQGRPLEDELLHLAVHGLAHLCGYDHATPDEERVMFAWEAALRERVVRR